MWDGVRRGLDPRYRVLAPDLPGHGSRRGETFTLPGAIMCIVSTARSVANSPVVMIGDSLGGYTAMASAASLPPSQLKGLVLGGCSSNLTGRRLLPYRLQAALFGAVVALRLEDRLIASMAGKLVSQVPMRQDDADAMLGAGISLRVFPQAVKALANIDFRAKLAAIEQPVLILNGTQDRGHMRQEPGFVAVAREATVHHFADCQHGVTMRRPAECARLINDFSARVFRTLA
jgi:pimeloyl-ACP methyl ester carboxylesterase